MFQEGLVEPLNHAIPSGLLNDVTHAPFIV